MTILEAFILGLVQGLTEFIPVSSSGHLLLAQRVFENSETLSFDVMLHMGTLLALVVYFRRDILSLIVNVTKHNQQGKMARIILFATLPAAIAGLLFSDFIDDTLRSPLFTALGLALVGLVMLYADRINHQSSDEISRKQGIKIGVAQAFALVPGVSRSGATITAGLLLGLSREQATRFSFLLAMPIIAGSALGLLLKGDLVVSGLALPLVVGMVTAFISGLLAIAFMLKFISSWGLKPFAYYRIGLAFIVVLFLL